MPTIVEFHEGGEGVEIVVFVFGEGILIADGELVHYRDGGVVVAEGVDWARREFSDEIGVLIMSGCDGHSESFQRFRLYS